MKLVRKGILLIVIGAAIWFADHALVQQCSTEMNIFTGTGTCTGLPAAGWHLQGIAVIAAILLGLTGVIVILAGSDKHRQDTERKGNA